MLLVLAPSTPMHQEDSKMDTPTRTASSLTNLTEQLYGDSDGGGDVVGRKDDDDEVNRGCGGSSVFSSSDCSDRTYDGCAGSVRNHSTDDVDVPVGSNKIGMASTMMFPTSSSLFASLFARRLSRTRKGSTSAEDETEEYNNKSICHQSLSASTLRNSPGSKRGIAHRVIRKVSKLTLRMTSSTSTANISSGNTTTTPGKSATRNQEGPTTTAGKVSVSPEDKKNHSTNLRRSYRNNKKGETDKKEDGQEEQESDAAFLGYEVIIKPKPSSSSTSLSSSPYLRPSLVRPLKTKEEAMQQIKTMLPPITGETPQEYLDHMLSLRGYNTRRYQALETAYYSSEPTPLQLASYGVRLLEMISKNEEEEVESCLLAGIHHNPCNEYNESVVHKVCYHGSASLLEIVLDHDVNTTSIIAADGNIKCSIVQIADDFGKTPLHEVCRSPQLSYHIVEMLMTNDIHLFYIEDARGNTPLEVLLPDYWYDMISFLEKRLDRFWPPRTTDGVDESPTEWISPLVLQKPNTRVVRDPDSPLSNELAWMVVSGIIEPEEAISFMDEKVFQRFLPTIQDRLNDVAKEEEMKEKIHYENKLNDYRNDQDDALTV